MSIESEKLTSLAPRGHCAYGTLQLGKSRFPGWWWINTPKKNLPGPTYQPIFIGADYKEALDYAIIHWPL